MHGFTVAELYDISVNSLKTSFLPEEMIEKHLKEFQKRYENIVS